MLIACIGVLGLSTLYCEFALHRSGAGEGDGVLHICDTNFKVAPFFVQVEFGSEIFYVCTLKLALFSHECGYIKIN